MLSIEAPTPFVLTLQSVPPFLVESILALALVVLLAVPLIAHIQQLLDNNSRSSKMVEATQRNQDSENHRPNLARTIVMHYPVPCKIHKNSNSDLNVELTSMRTALSTPAIKPSLESFTNETSNENISFVHHGFEHRKQAVQKVSPNKKNACLLLERSSSFVATNAQLPIIDISAFDYDAYRHKLIETSLKRQYGDRQAPGNVVLNSIHLNSIGSQAGIELSETYSHSLFDFIEEYYDATTALSKKEKEYLHPLDHFLVKGTARPSTAERATETKQSNTKLDLVPELIDFHENTPIPIAISRGNFEKRKALEESTVNPSKITIRSRRSFSLPRSSSRTSNTPKAHLATTGWKSSVKPMTRELFSRVEKLNSNVNTVSKIGAASTDRMSPRKLVEAPVLRASRSRTPRSYDDKVPQLPRAIEALRKRPSSANQGKSSAESFTAGKVKPGEHCEAPSIDHDQKESATCLSITPSEAESGCSSKRRDKSSVRPRASSLSSKNRKLEKNSSQTRQWYVGYNTNSSFNSNYYEIQKDTGLKIAKPKMNIRPKSTGGRFDWDVPDVPGHSCCDGESVNLDGKKSFVPTIVKRPKTVNPVKKRHRTPEMGKLSDTVLPVLESVFDLRVDVPWDDQIDCGIDNDPGTSLQKLRGASTFKQRDFKQPVRPSDKNLSSASFVKSSKTTRPSEVESTGKKHSAERKCIHKDRFVEPQSNNGNLMEPQTNMEQSSSEIKTTSKHSGSTSRLPVHVGPDKSVIKAMIRSPRGLESFQSRDNLFVQSSRRVEKKSSGILGRRTRPRTAGYQQSRTSSLSPKIELSLETLQPEKLATASEEISKKLRHEHSVEKKNYKQILAHDTSKIPHGLPNIDDKKITPISRTSSHRMVKPSCPISVNGTDTSQMDVDDETTGKKPFLRARSGKYGAPKMNAIQQARKAPIADASSTKKTTTKNEGLEEMDLLKLPTEGSKAALVMRRELKTYIKKIKLILSVRDKSLQAKDLASLSITEAIVPELRAHLSPREVQELQSLLDRVEKQQGNMLRDSLALSPHL